MVVSSPALDNIQGRIKGYKEALAEAGLQDRAQIVVGGVTVESSRLLPNGRWVVKFDVIADRTDAESWTNVALHSAPIDDPDALWFHDLIGSTVVEVDGTERGTCVSVLDNPAADILQLDSGALVPTNFVVSHVDRVLTVDVPDGLFELADD